MTINLFDCVESLVDIPELDLKKNMVGVVTEIFTKPDLRYEVEFCNKRGETISFANLALNQIMKLENISKEDYRNRKPD